MGDSRTPQNAEYFLDVLDEQGLVLRQIPLAQRATVGRSSAGSMPDVVVPADCGSVSRRHATIEICQPQPVLTDHSAYGTTVNNAPITNTSVGLDHGDLIVFGLPQDGWRVRFRSVGESSRTIPPDPLSMLVVSERPRQVSVGRLILDEQLGNRAFRLLTFLWDHRGEWYTTNHLVDLLWPDLDALPLEAKQALSRYKRIINDLLRPHLAGEDAVEMHPHKGYRMKLRLDHQPPDKGAW